MSNVSLQIGGRDFSVACADGEEQHVAMLGRQIDDRLRTMGAAGQSESRMLLFAALVLADELHELRHRSEAPPPADNSVEIDRLCSGIETAAERIEKLAEHLEQAAAPP